MKVVTENSTYEFDFQNQRVRRESGLNPPTQRFSPDGEWKPFRNIVQQGDMTLVVWPEAGKATALSPITKITDEFGAPYPNTVSLPMAAVLEQEKRQLRGKN